MEVTCAPWPCARCIAPHSQHGHDSLAETKFFGSMEELIECHSRESLERYFPDLPMVLGKPLLRS